MKTTIITLAIAALLSIGNSFGSNKVYYNAEGDKEEGTVTTAYNGVDDRYLTPFQRNVSKYNSDKSLTERITYKWNANAKEWAISHKYTYEYNRAGQLSIISYTEWNKSKKSWNKNVEYAMYIYNPETGSPFIKHLTEADKAAMK